MLNPISLVIAFIGFVVAVATIVVTNRHADLESANDGALAKWMGKYLDFKPTDTLKTVFDNLARGNVYVPTGIAVVFTFVAFAGPAWMLIVAIGGWCVAGSAVLADRYFTHLRPAQKRPDLAPVPATEETEIQQLVLGTGAVALGVFWAGAGLIFEVITPLTAFGVVAGGVALGVSLFAPLVPLLRVTRHFGGLGLLEPTPLNPNPLTADDLPNGSPLEGTD